MSVLCKPFDRLPAMFVKDCGYIPVVLTNAAFAIEKNIKTKNLFQTQGNVSKVNASLSRLAAPRLSKMRDDNIHDVIEAMKTFLVRMPKPLLPEAICDALISIPQDENSTSLYMAVLTTFRKSAPQSFAVLHFMMILLKKISEHVEHNCMDIRKLATVFVLDILKPFKLEDSNESPQQQGLILIDRMQRLPYLIMVVENFISHVEIFKSVSAIRGVAPSPRGSGTSLPKSNTGISPGACRSSFTETRALVKQSEVDQDEDGTVLSIKDTDMQEARDDIIEKRAAKETGQTSFDLLARAVSEPQQVGTQTMNIPKRCMTDIPVYNNEVFFDIHNPLDETLKNRQYLSLTVAESPVTPEEPGMGQETKPVHPAPGVDTKAMDKQYAPAGTSTSFDKKPHAPKGAACSPAHKVAANNERDEASHNMSLVKVNRSLDNRIAVIKEKRKRKSRSTYKKSKNDKENGLIDNFCRSSDLVMFQPDEEITPWNEGSINSDDVSVMVKTIRNPRILAYKAITPMNEEAEAQLIMKARDRVGPLDNMSQILLENSLFRTISSQNSTAANSNVSDASVTSLVNQSTNLRQNQQSEVCVQCSSHEATPISKDLIRGVKLKGSVGVNTSPYQKRSASREKTEDGRNNFQQMKEIPATKVSLTNIREQKINQRAIATSNSRNYTTSCMRPSFFNPTSMRPPIINQTSMNATETQCSTPYGGSTKGLGCVPRSHMSSIQQQHSRTSVPRQVISVTAGNYPSETHVKFRHQQQRARKPEREPSSGHQHKTSTHLTRYAHPQCLSVGEWFVYIILVCITFVCVFLIFFYHNYSHGQGGWLSY